MTYERRWDPDTNPVAIELTYPPTEGTPKYKSSKRLTVIQFRNKMRKSATSNQMLLRGKKKCRIIISWVSF